MYTKQDLMGFLATLGVCADGVLMVHLSYKAIGDVEGRGDTVLDALMDYMARGLLVLPCHTWDNVGKDNPVMDVLHTPSCIGRLPEMFRMRPGVRRSLHPTHSLAAAGDGAAELLAGEELIGTPCGKGGAYYKLWERNAQILMIGANFTSNTFIHGIEEWDHAEGTISQEKTDLYVIDYEGRRLYTPQHRHCAPLGSDTFSKLEPPAYKEGILEFGRFGDATARLMRAAPLREMTARLLDENKRYLMTY